MERRHSAAQRHSAAPGYSALRRGLSVTAAALLASGTLTACSAETEPADGTEPAAISTLEPGVSSSPATDEPWFQASEQEQDGVSFVTFDFTGAVNTGFPDIARYGTLAYADECWRITMDEYPDGGGETYAVAWWREAQVIGGPPPYTIQVEQDRSEKVSDGEYLMFGGGELGADVTEGFPEQCLAGTDGIMAITGARHQPE